MSSYTENSFSKKANRNSKKIKDAGKIVASLGATAYFTAKSTPKYKSSKNKYTNTSIKHNQIQAIIKYFKSN